MKRLSTILLVCLLPMLASAAGLPALEALESRLESSKAMQMLNAEYEIARNRLEQEESRNGASFYSHTTFADSDEVVDVGRSRSYQQLASGIGVRVPVLGSRMQWQQSVANRSLELERLDAEHELRRRELLRDLRSAYAQYWGSQRLASLSRAYLEHEAAIERGLALRARSGLLLDADRLEFMSGFSMARRDAALSEADGARAFQTLQYLGGAALEEGAVMKPTLAPSCTPANAVIATIVAAHPEVKYLEQAQVHALATRVESPLYGVNSEVRIGYHASTEWPVEEQGGSAAITWSFDVPINFLNQRKLARSSAAAARSHAQLEYELRKQQIEQALRALLAQRAVLGQSLQFANVRLAAGEESVRERELRAAKLAGDVIEQLQQSRLSRYNAAKAVVEAQLALANWTAEWSMHAPTTCRDRSLYVWSSSSLIEQLARGDESAATRLGIEHLSTLLVSLDAAQLEMYRKDPTTLRAALDAAHRRGVKIELLLGEPTWLLPEQRRQLLEIVRDLRALPFDGLHLDIEPDQLSALKRETESLWAEWLATVRSVREASPWPLDVSLHPRYLDLQIEERALGDHLAAAEVDVTLMIYVANAERVVAIAQPLLARYPQLVQRIALSTEDSLSTEESMYSLSLDERARRIAYLESRLVAPNFQGVTIQPSREPVAGLSTMTQSMCNGVEKMGAGCGQLRHSTESY